MRIGSFPELPIGCVDLLYCIHGITPTGFILDPNMQITKRLIMFYEETDSPRTAYRVSSAEMLMSAEQQLEVDKTGARMTQGNMSQISRKISRSWRVGAANWLGPSLASFSVHTNVYSLMKSRRNMYLSKWGRIIVLFIKPNQRFFILFDQYVMSNA